MQIEDYITSISQPGFNFSRLKRAVPGAEVAIEQFCNLLGRARLFDLVQRPNDVFVEPATGACDLAYLR